MEREMHTTSETGKWWTARAAHRVVHLLMRVPVLPVVVLPVVVVVAMAVVVPVVVVICRGWVGDV